MSRFIERAALVLIALTLSGALWRAFGEAASAGIEGDSRIEVLLVLVYSAVAILAARELGWTMWSLRRNPALLALLVLACVSPIWSDSPDLVFRRTLGLGGATLFGIVLATRLSTDEMLRVLRWTFRIAAAATLAVILVAPSRALMPGGDVGVRGVFAHKNGLGATMALAFLVERYLRDAGLTAKILRFFSLGTFAGLLVVSNSMTSVLTLLVTLAGMWTLQTFCVRQGVPLSVLVIGSLSAVIGAVAMGIGPDDVLGLVGRSSDITGRTELWSGVADSIAQKPILGYGFSGFWRGAVAGSDALQGQIQWAPIYSHNGYLEVALSLGLVGLSFAILLLAIGFKRAWAGCRMGNSPLDCWPMALLMFIAIHNLTECSIAWQNCLEWSVCIATVVACDPEVRTMFEPSAEVEEGLPDLA